MDDFKTRVKNVAESAGDIVRDKLDTFRKLNKQQQQLLLALVGVVFIVLLVWLFMPRKINVFVERNLMDDIMDNQVIVENREEKPLKKVKVILNDSYVYEIPQLEKEVTTPIKVTEFRPINDPTGAPPASNTVPRKVVVIAKGGRFLKEFK